ncbi:hypothetical protein Hanom_Chr12g01160391 [Helianthus anomalus]
MCFTTQVIDSEIFLDKLGSEIDEGNRFAGEDIRIYGVAFEFLQNSLDDRL